MQQNILYTASNTNLQEIDVINLPEERVVRYVVQVVDRVNTSVCYLEVNHDGVSMTEFQAGFSNINNERPAEITTSVSNNVGVVSVAPLRAPAEFLIERTSTPVVLYGDSTISGRLINGVEGVGIAFTTSPYNMTIRQSNNNFFGQANTFMVANTLGPVVTGPELFAVDNIESFMGSELLTESNTIQIVASGQPKNHNFIKLSTTAETIYRISFDAAYLFDTVRGDINSYDVGCAFTVGKSVGKQEYTGFPITETMTSYVSDVVGDGTDIYIGFGYGSLGTTLSLENVSIKELVPHHTYDQVQGTVYVKWNALPSNTIILQAGLNSVYVDSANDVFVNDVACGAQQLVNRLAYTYSANGITFSFNGSTASLLSNTYNSQVSSIVFSTIPDEYSYTNSILSSEVLEEITGV